MGMNNKNGQRIEGIAWLRQRLADVMTTPIGSRVMRREYGSELFNLIDQPMSSGWRVQIYAAVAKAVENPVNGLADFKVRQVLVNTLADGQAELDVYGVYVPTNDLVKVEGIKL